MNNQNTLLSYTMTKGLYLGLAFSVVITVFKLFGVVHVPGGDTATVNMLVLAFGFLYWGRKYRAQYHADGFTYGQAFKMLFLLGFFASFIFAFFAYWYYLKIEPKGIDVFITQIEQLFEQTNTIDQAQRDALLTLYKTGLTPAVMATLIGFYQTITSVFMALIAAFLVKLQKPISE